MQQGRYLIRLELFQLWRDRAFVSLMLLLFVLMALASVNTFLHLENKKAQIVEQEELVQQADRALIAQIDSLYRGLATYETSYTLPTSGVRLTYNNHRVTRLPFKPLALLAIGQGDLYSNYKKIVLYFNESYEMSSQELVSPLEQLFGQLDLAFIWVYLLPLIILLVSYNILSLEKETGRLPLIASQPINLSYWVSLKILLRFITISTCIVLFTGTLLLVFGVALWNHLLTMAQLMGLLLLYSAFWFFLSLLINLAGFSSGKSLIVLTSIWVLFVFLIPTTITQIGKELNPVSSRLEVINHHQAMYNEMEANLEAEKEKLFELHPSWKSEDPVTQDMSNSTGWNIDFLAKQYIAQFKHRPKAEAYEQEVDARNAWFNRFRIFSPAMILQESLANIAGTSIGHYRSFLRQSQAYAHEYRAYVFQGLFTNHAFTAQEVKELESFEFDEGQVPDSFSNDFFTLLVYLGFLSLGSIWLVSRKPQII